MYFVWINTISLTYFKPFTSKMPAKRKVQVARKVSMEERSHPPSPPPPKRTLEPKEMDHGQEPDTDGENRSTDVRSKGKRLLLTLYCTDNLFLNNIKETRYGNVKLTCLEGLQCV